jgi:hypothetical protein
MASNNFPASSASAKTPRATGGAGGTIEGTEQGIDPGERVAGPVRPHRELRPPALQDADGGLAAVREVGQGRDRVEGRPEGGVVINEKRPGHQLLEIARVALNRCTNRLRPGQHVGAGAIAPFLHQGARHVGDGVRVHCKLREPAGNAHRARRRSHPERGGESAERLFQLLSTHRLSSPVIRESAQ